MVKLLVWAETPEGIATGKMTSNENVTIKSIALVRFIEFTKRRFCYVMLTYLFTFTVNSVMFRAESFKNKSNLLNLVVVGQQIPKTTTSNGLPSVLDTC
jgi:uncharacterized membrane protein YgaE (UPF0421/DUF939 family)